MVEVRFDTYYRYEAISAFLADWAARYPQLCRIESLGKSHEGRDIWIAILTSAATGLDTEKPAYWVDGNIHATEVSPSSAALYLIHMLLTGYDSDPRITHALDTRVFYVVPRLNPDGAEWALADIPREIRSSTRPYPREDRLDGLHREDVDRDGRMLQMRIRDPHGAWKVHPEEPRLMIPREPDDLPGGDYYRLLPEGIIQNYDGVTIPGAPPLQGLDLNRNFPVFWEPGEQGAGDYPGSEPEARVAIEFISKHRNITGSVSFHTFSGVWLRPPTKAGDDSLPTQDLRTYKALGAKAKAMTGYPAVSVFHDFKYDPKDFIKGTFDDWMYEHVGVYGWTCEIWSVQAQAGLKDIKFIEWFDDHPVEHDLQILKWLDETLDGEGYIDWYAFDHPQLGPVELGGWHAHVTWRNPPLKLLEKEIKPLAEFCLVSALASPRLELFDLTVTPQGGDNYHLRLVLHNTGWLPTNVTEQALKMKVVKPLEVRLALPEGASLISGKELTFAGQLAGRDQKGMFTVWNADTTEERVRLEWVINAPAGGQVDITAIHERAGTVRAAAALDA